MALPPFIAAAYGSLPLSPLGSRRAWPSEHRGQQTHCDLNSYHQSLVLLCRIIVISFWANFAEEMGTI